MTKYLRFNSPTYNLQVLLRTISKRYSDIPTLIPDGVYGNNTRDSVLAFQKQFGLNPTGETDYSSWNKLIQVFLEIETEYKEPYVRLIYPENELREDQTSYTSTVYIIQIMLVALAERFDNISMPSVNGIIDHPTIESINAVKLVSGLNPDGNINKMFWEYISAIYGVYVSGNRILT